MKYRKKPVEIEAEPWLGHNPLVLKTFARGNFHVLSEEDRQACDDPDATAEVFDDLHSTWVLVFTGDYIIRGVKGEFYPCRPDVFAETYEQVL